MFFFQNSASVRPQKVLEHGVMDVHRTRGLMDPLWRGHGHTGAGFGLFIRLANRKKDIFFSRLYPIDLQTWTHDYDFSVIYADLILNWQMYLNAMRDFTACGGTRCARVKINAHMPLPSVSFHSPLYTDSWCLLHNAWHLPSLALPVAMLIPISSLLFLLAAVNCAADTAHVKDSALTHNT